MNYLGKPLYTRFRCKTETVKCKVCGKPFVRKINKLRGSVQMPSNRTTCSKKCSRINLYNYRVTYQKEWREKRKLNKLQQL